MAYPDTLAEAIGLLRTPPWACACITDGESCCVRGFARARVLRRAAHIAVRQLSDLADRRAADPSWKVET